MILEITDRYLFYLFCLNYLRVFNDPYKLIVCHDLLIYRQSGFRSKHLCETALHLLVDWWLSSIYNEEIEGVLFIYFCKAFDMVGHDILSNKLKLYNFSQDLISWFTSYLSNGQQCVKINHKYHNHYKLSMVYPRPLFWDHCYLFYLSMIYFSRID